MNRPQEQWCWKSATTRTRFHRRRPSVEGLEARRLLAVAIQEFPTPVPASFPVGITTGPDGNLWFTDQGFASQTGRIGVINPSTHSVTEFLIPTTPSSPVAITTGPDGNLWFTDRGSNTPFDGGKVGFINPATHSIREFAVGTGTFASPGAITTGADGNLWFTDGSNLAEINPTTYAITVHPFPDQSGGGGITAGPDGNLWFTAGNKVGTINPTTLAIQEFPVASPNSHPVAITSGADGNLWFTEINDSTNDNSIGMIDPTTHIISEFRLTPGVIGNLPAITAGPDGNIWFTDRDLSNVTPNSPGKIGTISTTTHLITEYSISAPGTLLNGIATGPDGNLWYANGAGSIGQVNLNAQADLALSGVTTALPAGGGQVFTSYTIRVSNVGMTAATGVTLTDTLPPNSTFISATGQAKPVNNVLTFLLGNLGVGASVTVTIVVHPSVPGTMINTASVSGNGIVANSPGNTITQYAPVPSASQSGDGPTVVNVQRFGILSQPTVLVLTFSGPLDSARASDVSNYRIVARGKSGRTGPAIPVTSATYDAATQTVTLQFGGRLSLNNAYQLTVFGATPGGLTDTSGTPLDGVGRGVAGPGSDYTRTIDRSTLVGSSRKPPVGKGRHHPARVAVSRI